MPHYTDSETCLGARVYVEVLCAGGDHQMASKAACDEADKRRLWRLALERAKRRTVLRVIERRGDR